MLAFLLGMTLAQAREVCPKPLITVYEKLHTETHFMCDDGKRSTVLIFDGDSLTAIMDIKHFAQRYR